MEQTWPDRYDSLPGIPGEPKDHHLRECLENGYPLMGSSPAERADFHRRVAESRRRAMRDHPFVGDGPYCAAMLGPAISGSANVGFVSMHVGCGYPPDVHPEPVETDEATPAGRGGGLPSDGPPVAEVGSILGREPSVRTVAPYPTEEADRGDAQYRAFGDSDRAHVDLCGRGPADPCFEDDFTEECSCWCHRRNQAALVTGSSASGGNAPLGITRAPVSEQVRHLNGPMLARLRACAADTSPNWDGKVTIYPPEARDLVSLIDAALREAGRD